MQHKVIKKVLMCEPTHFDELNYSINPWMKPGTINATKSQAEWDKLVSIYKNLGIDVEKIKPQKSNPDMVFATDQGIVEGKKVLLSRFWTQERRGESKYYEAWFRMHGYKVEKLPEDIYFEGNGNAFIWNDFLLIGIGYRANEKTAEALQKVFDREVIPMKVTNPAFYHIDVAFFPLNEETIFYYPEAFSQKTQDFLHKNVPNLIKLKEEEVNNFAANSIVTDHHVVHQAGNPEFQKEIERLGYTSVEIDLSEFKKSGGGVHCLTNILEEN